MRNYKCKMPSRPKDKLNRSYFSVQRDTNNLVIAQGRMKYMLQGASSIYEGSEEEVDGL